MARSCAICGKISMGWLQPPVVGMNRVRAHRRIQPNLQPLVIDARRASRPRRSSAPAAAGRCRRPPARTSRRRSGADARGTDRSSSDGRSFASPAAQRSALSSQIVNGPSLTSSTAISAPNRPGRDASTPGRAQRVGEPLVEPLGELRRRGVR